MALEVVTVIVDMHYLRVTIILDMYMVLFSSMPPSSLRCNSTRVVIASKRQAKKRVASLHRIGTPSRWQCAAALAGPLASPPAAE